MFVCIRPYVGHLSVTMFIYLILWKINFEFNFSFVPFEHDLENWNLKVVFFFQTVWYTIIDYTLRMLDVIVPCLSNWLHCIEKWTLNRTALIEFVFLRTQLDFILRTRCSFFDPQMLCNMRPLHFLHKRTPTVSANCITLACSYF